MICSLGLPSSITQAADHHKLTFNLTHRTTVLITTGTQLQLLCFDRSPRPSPCFAAASLCSDQGAHPCTQTDASKPSFAEPPPSLQTTPEPSGSDQICCTTTEPSSPHHLSVAAPITTSRLHHQPVLSPASLP
ncbi:hypothetical protein M0R45_025839 [Rubus argutus]|uniref:Uncharacterized protein n=1 Tax=Rubus argutus TaxID=59490 RepID=A0AAW1WXK6_RUBAR